MVVVAESRASASQECAASHLASEQARWREVTRGPARIPMAPALPHLDFPAEPLVMEAVDFI
jgi:hypothetical protein